MSRLCLVTGGAGFIGSSIVRALSARGDMVRVIDDLSTGSRDNLAVSSGASPAQLIEGDILDEGVLARAVAGVEVVFHQAAVSSVPRSVLDPALTHEVNATGTLRVLAAARAAGVRRVVYAASASAYGNSPAQRKTETLAPDPVSPYAVSKLVGEYYCRSFHAVYGFQTVALRYFNVFGPRQDPASEYAAVIPRFVTAALLGRPPVVFGDGEQSRDFCHIDDIVAANLAAADAPEASGRVVNIASGHAVSLNEVVKLLGEILGAPIVCRYEERRAGDVRHSLADVTLAGSILGYLPKVVFKDGLRNTIDWYRGGA